MSVKQLADNKFIVIDDNTGRAAGKYRSRPAAARMDAIINPKEETPAAPKKAKKAKKQVEGQVVEESSSVEE